MIRVQKHLFILLFSTFFTTPAVPATPPCFDPNEPNDVRLWPGAAPGAKGSDPCKDIPFLRVFRPKRPDSATDVGIIIFPGGGYNQLTNQNEQEPVAQYFSDKFGVTAFVLYYRLVQTDGTYRYPVPMWDGQRAIRYIRYHASEFGINPHHLGVFGFSAGGHLASTIAIHFEGNFELPLPRDVVDETDARPDFMGLGYPVISMDPKQFASDASLRHLLHGYSGAELEQLQNYLSGQKQANSTTPPTFLFESFDDKIVDAQNSSLFCQAMAMARVPNETHLFQRGKHGAGLAVDEPDEDVWPELFHNWLCEQGLISKPWKLVPAGTE